MASGARYAGKVVVVTGAARGIGAGIARAFVDSGAQVVICDKDERGGRALEQELRRAVFIRCDVTREEDVRALLSDTVHRFGRLDCVVNNAGSVSCEPAPSSCSSVSPAPRCGSPQA
nr:17-beta-hydroxysteroid dehydrogenase 14 [Oryctolagus cuniculus]